MAKNLVIFQNYFTPYRAKLFQEIGTHTDLTVVYIHKPEDEGRKWTEDEFVDSQKKSYKTLQMNHRKFGPVLWTMKLSALKKVVTNETRIVYLDNLPTNISMLLGIMPSLANIVPRKQRYLWVEHQYVKETHGPPIPFYREVKMLYKTIFSWLFALSVDHIIAFSDVSVEYCKKIGLPLTGQDIVRTYQAAYTTAEIALYRQEAEKMRTYSPSTITFGFLGYFTKRKGLAELLGAIKFDKNDQAKFVFIGDGPEKQMLLEAADKDSRISVVPYITSEQEKTDMFMKMDVLVLPSDKDPWGLVVNEAASRGVPAIVSPYVGSKEMIAKIDPTFIMADNKTMNITKALVDVTTLHADKTKWDTIITKTFAVAAEWSIERAAETFSSIVK